MQKDFALPSSILFTLLAIFVFVYPNLYYPVVNPFLSWSVPRLVLLFVFAILGILSIKNLRMPKFLVFFILVNFVLIFIQLFNQKEDEIIYTILGNDDRFEGIFYQFLVILFAVFAYYSLIIIKYSKKFLLFLSLSGVFHTLVIINQYTLVPFNILGREISFTFDGVPGLTGRAGYIAGFLICVIAVSIYLSLEKSRFYSILGYIFLLMNCVGLSLLQNRSSTIAMTIGLVVWIFLRKVNLQFLLTLAVAIILINFSDRIFVTNQSFVRNTADTTTLSTRFEIWKIAFKLMPDNWGFPFFGGGTGAFKLAISDKLPILDLMNFYQKEYNLQPNVNIKKTIIISDEKISKRQKTFVVFYKDKSQQVYSLTLDRAHNFFLDKIFSIGLIGAVFWMIFYIYPIYAFFRLERSKRSFFLQALVVTLIAVQIYYIFWFSVLQVEPIHIIVALMAWVALERIKNEPATTQLPVVLETQALSAPANL